MDFFKLSIKFIFAGLICFSSFISCTHENRHGVIIGEEYFSSREKQIDNIFEIGHIEKIIKFEKSDDALFANADRIRIDNEGHIYLLDRFSQQEIFHFDQKGKFLNKYGKHGQGPGEYQSLEDFDLDSIGNLYLISGDKLIKFNKTGELLEEEKISIQSGGMKIIEDKLYVYVKRDRLKRPQSKSSVYVYNTRLKKIDEIGDYEQNLMKYIYSPRILLDGSNNKLYFIDVYNLSFSKYDTENHMLTKFLFSNKNNSLENIWNKSRLDENDRTEIKSKLHRFDDILYFNNNLFVTETCREADTYNFWLIDLENNNIDKYLYFKLINSSSEPQDYLNFDYIAGSYSNGLILVIDDNERFSKYKNKIKEFQNIEFSINDSPLIVFFRLKD